MRSARRQTKVLKGKSIMNTKVKKSESSLISQLLMGNRALFILLALILIMAFASPVFFTSDNLLNVVRQVAYSAVMGAGFTLVLGSGHMDLSIGCMVGLSLIHI